MYASFQSLVVDVLIAVVLVFSVFRGIKTGFIASLLRMLSFVISAVAAFFLSSTLANFIYDAFLKAPAVQLVTDSLNGSSGLSDVLASLGELMAKLPLPVLGAVGIDTSHLGAEGLEELLSESVATASDYIVENIISPPMLMLLRVILFILLLFLFSLVLRLLIRALRILDHIPVVSQLNALLGSVTGFLSGVLWVFVIVAAINTYASVAGAEAWITQQQIEQTFLFQFFAGLIPFSF